MRMNGLIKSAVIFGAIALFFAIAGWSDLEVVNPVKDIVRAIAMIFASLSLFDLAQAALGKGKKPTHKKTNKQ